MCEGGFAQTLKEVKGLNDWHRIWMKAHQRLDSLVCWGLKRREGSVFTTPNKQFWESNHILLSMSNLWLTVTPAAGQL